MARDKAYREAEKKIEEARLSGATVLDLSGGWDDESPRLSELPESLGKLTQLQSLILFRNQLTSLPVWLGHLTQLQSLDIANNELTAVPESLGQLTQLQSLDLAANQLTALPLSLSQFTRMNALNLSNNELTALPESLGHLTELQSLDLSSNKFTDLPEALGRLKQLNRLSLSGTQLKSTKPIAKLTNLRSLSIKGPQLTALPISLGEFNGLESLYLTDRKLTSLPSWIARLSKLSGLYVYSSGLTAVPSWIEQLGELQELWLAGNKLTSLPDSLGSLSELSKLTLNNNDLSDLPTSVAQLDHLEVLGLDDNPLNPELAAAYKEGLEAVKRYLRAKAEAQIVLNEAKLILIGEGEVGKSCLLGALRGDQWVEGRPTTHGIEIKPVNVTDPDSGTKITLNGWDFGGQRVYRPTHQLFFSAPAVYLVAWKPREGPQQGFVKEWISLVKHREPDAKILVVATHGGPGERQPDIGKQELWDLFGRDTVLDFFHVDSKPDKETAGRRGIAALKDGIARVAASLPEMGARCRLAGSRHARR